MIKDSSGSLLDAEVEALVNTVNTVGIMGKGIALQFKRAFPDMFKDYERVARHGQIRLGQMYVWETHALHGPRYVINFPTKSHWRAKSRLRDIEHGLQDLIRLVREHQIRSIAVPPLGCGNGGLAWGDVRPLIEAAFAQIPEVDVRLYAPGATPAAADMPTRTRRPRMTAGRAALIHLLSRYTERSLSASLIEIQKLMYFLQEAGEPLRLSFVKGRYGPYADNLRHVLQDVEGHFLSGYGDASRKVDDAEALTVLEGAPEQANRFLEVHPATVQRVERVLDLIAGFESAYGMELLASVHWLAVHEEPSAQEPSVASQQVHAWTARKSRMYTDEHVEVAWQHLSDGGWLPAA